ncbi:MAG TPA: cation-translocating P-type ATPase, partial [Pseudonocardiaceae bacterium]|nr:cation-translocating P-type ATPase [Pseudonocardiaceae bacterium]
MGPFDPGRLEQMSNGLGTHCVPTVVRTWRGAIEGRRRLIVLGGVARLSVVAAGVALKASAQVVRGAGCVVGRAVQVAAEANTIGVGVVGGAARVSRTAARSATGVLGRAVAVGAPYWRHGQRFHLPLRARTGSVAAQQAIKKVAAGVLEHPDVLVAYWDGGLQRLVVQVAENAVTDRVVERVSALAARHGLVCSAAPAPDTAHPGDVTEVRTAAVCLALDTAALAGALMAAMVRLRRPPQVISAVSALMREDPRVGALLVSQFGKPTADLVLAAISAATAGIGQSPTELVLDAALRTGQLVEAIARAAAFDAAHDQLCVPERISLAPTAPMRRPAPADSLQDYAVNATTASVIGAAATLLWKRNTEQASAAVLAGSPKPARYGWAAYQARVGCALAADGVLVRDAARLRLLRMVDAVVVHAAALAGTQRTVGEVYPSVDEWSHAQLWQAAAGALTTTDSGPTDLWLRPAPDNGHADTGLMIASAHGQDVGTVLVDYQPDPLAQAVLDAARHAGLRIVVVGHGAGQHAGQADEVIDPNRDMSQVVSGLQDQGHTVLTLARLRATQQHHNDDLAFRDSDVLAGLLCGDLAVTLADRDSAVVWAADVVCARGLAGMWRVLHAVPAARTASKHARIYAQAGAALSGLLVVTGGQQRWSTVLFPLARVSSVDLAAAAALVSGWWLARGVATSATPAPRLQIPWHALNPREVLRVTRNWRRRSAASQPGADHRAGLPSSMSGWAVAAPLRLSLQLANAVRGELNDPLTPVLAVGAAASAVLGSPVDALLVLGALSMNAVVGGVQRLRADRALASLVTAQQQKARRVHGTGDQIEVINATQLARGDVIELAVGDVVPADARLLELTDLEIDESALTGESVPVTKQVAACVGGPGGQRRCMVFEATTVVAGQARAVVVDTGEHTEAARAITLASRTPPAAGVQARLHELTRKAVPLTLLGGAAVTGLSLLRGHSMRQALSGGVAVAVAAVPEGLPLVATVAQMAAARRLSRRGILVRTPRALEALGRMDTVCFDKTGTLTENQLRVVRVTARDGTAYPPTEPAACAVLQTAARACPQEQHSSRQHSHATDEAVRAAAAPDPGWEQILGQPFEAHRGYAAAVGTTPTTTALLAVKGAPEIILPCCLDADPADVAVAETLAGQGLRVLAVAHRSIELAQAEEALDKPLSGLQFLGFVALADTPRPSSALLVSGLRDRGVRPVMITGDHPQTALAIARALGWPPQTTVVTGDQLAAVDRAGRAQILHHAAVIARVAPEQKLQVIEALHEAGRVVAMVGDGANDAAAIRAADIGIGIAARGSAAARNAADLVLTNDDLTVLIHAATEGQTLWHSVADAVSILLGGNAGEVGFTILGTLISGASPLSTRQLLLINLLTDMFPAMAIAVTPTSDNAHRCQGSGSLGTAVLDAPLTRQIRDRGILTGLGATSAWLIGALTPGSARRTSTMALCGLVGAQLTQTLIGRHHSPLILATSLGSAAALFVIVQTPGL